VLEFRVKILVSENYKARCRETPALDNLLFSGALRKTLIAINFDFEVSLKGYLSFATVQTLLCLSTYYLYSFLCTGS